MADDLRRFSIDEARRIAIAAQGLHESRPQLGTVSLADLDRVVNRINIVQIDSVNVLVRAQYMPFFSRLGPYPTDLLHQFAYEERNLFEYSVHEASLLPMRHLSMIRHRMSEWRPWKRWTELMSEKPDLLPYIVDEIETRGPLEVADIEDKGERYGHWGTTSAKIILETMLHRGELAVSDRVNHARRYDLINRVVPSDVLASDPLNREESHLLMMKLAISSLGIGTIADCADYYRIKRTEAANAIQTLSERGEIERVKIDGVPSEIYAKPGIEPPSEASSATAIVSPFDPLVWHRQRIEWLFDFEYRIEIYTPVRKRKFGYYVMPFLLGDRLVARIDLKADRKAKVLRVPGAFSEVHADADEAAPRLATELRSMADWLGLERIVIGRRGSFTKPLRSAIKQL